MKTSERLIQRLIDECILNEGVYVAERLYHGYWQRREGAWSWEVLNGDGREVFVGSQWSMAEILRAPKILIDNAGSLYPTAPKPTDSNGTTHA